MDTNCFGHCIQNLIFFFFRTVYILRLNIHFVLSPFIAQICPWLYPDLWKYNYNAESGSRGLVGVETGVCVSGKLPSVADAVGLGHLEYKREVSSSLV